MGMYDSLYDELGYEWQTKALDQVLGSYHIGDRIPGEPIDYQVPVIGGNEHSEAYATICDGILTAVPVPRQADIPLVNYR